MWLAKSQASAHPLDEKQNDGHGPDIIALREVENLTILGGLRG